MCLKQLPLANHFFEAHFKFKFDCLHRLLERRAGGDMVAVRINADEIEVGDFLARQRVKFGNLLNIIAKEADPPRGIFIV